MKTLSHKLRKETGKMQVKVCSNFQLPDCGQSTDTFIANGSGCLVTRKFPCSETLCRAISDIKQLSDT